MRALCIAILVLGVATASAGKKKQKVRPVVVDRVEVVVDGEPIFRSDLTRYGALNGSPETAEAQMIDEVLILREARRLQVEVTPEEADAAIAEIAAQNNLDLAGLEAAVVQQGFTLAEYRIAILRQLTILRTTNVKFYGKVARDEYEAAMAQWLTDARAHAYIEHPGAP